jgi:WD40 repeat protein
VTAPNPYVGPRSFREDESGRFFGREEEIRRLRALAVARRAVLLYSPSGAGKTSLLQAGLLPHLRREVPGACPLPIVRLGGAAEAGSANPYIFHLLLDLLGDTSLSLQEGLARAVERAQQERGDEEAEAFFLVIDQGEEIFTLDPHRHDERRDFFVQLYEALEAHRRVTLILALREEYLAHLDPFLSYLPDRLRTRFRLDLLGPDAARQAIVEPAQQAGVQFTASAARRLVDDLGRGQPVDPVQLQVVCHRLWSRRPADAAAIDEDLVVAYADVDHALADYYAERVRSVATETGVEERAVRLWFERELITPQGVRGQVLAGETQKLDARAVAALVDSHLVRAEARRNAVWYELAHDRLIQPVRDDNREWLARNERPIDRLAQRASLWQKEGRPKRLLLKGRALRQAEREVANGGGETPAEVRALLDVCVRRRSLRRWLLAVLAVGLGALGSTAVYMGMDLVITVGESQLRRLRGEVLEAREKQLDLALLLALSTRQVEQVYASFEDFDLFDPPDSRQALSLALATEPRLETLLHTGGARVLSVAFRPDGRAVAAGAADGTIQLWSPAERRALTPPVPSPHGEVLGVAFRADGRVVSIHGDGSALLWDAGLERGPTLLAPDSPQVAAARPLPGPWSSAALSPDGRTLVSADLDGTLVFRDPRNGAPRGPAVDSGLGALTALAVRPDGKLALGSADGRITLWDPAARRPLGEPFRGWNVALQGLAFSPDGQTLVSGGGPAVAVWRPDAGPALGTVQTVLASRLYAAAFFRDRRALAVVETTGAGDPALGLWDLRTAQRRGGLLGSAPGLTTVAVDATGNVLAAGNAAGAVQFWSAAGSSPAFPAHAGPVAALAFDPWSGLLASGGRDGTVFLWRREGGRRAIPVTEDRSAVTSLAWLRIKHGKTFHRTLAVGTASGRALLWDAETGSAAGSQPVCDGPVTGLTPQSPRLAAGCSNGSVRLLGFLDEKQTIRSTITGPPIPVIRLAFSTDSPLLAAARADGTIDLIDIDREEIVAGPLRGHRGPVADLSFVSSKLLLSAGLDGRLIRWDTDPQSWRERACRIANRDLTPSEWSTYLPFFSVYLMRQPICQPTP